VLVELEVQRKTIEVLMEEFLHLDPQAHLAYFHLVAVEVATQPCLVVMVALAVVVETRLEDYQFLKVRALGVEIKQVLVVATIQQPGAQLVVVVLGALVQMVSLATVEQPAQVVQECPAQLLARQLLSQVVVVVLALPMELVLVRLAEVMVQELESHLFAVTLWQHLQQ
jgi:hypothetical protein